MARRDRKDPLARARRQLAELDAVLRELREAKRAFAAAALPSGVAVSDTPEFKRAQAAIHRAERLPDRAALEARIARLESRRAADRHG
jgi:hypothetical protein